MSKPEKNYALSKASLLVYINVSFRMFYCYEIHLKTNEFPN